MGGGSSSPQNDAKPAASSEPAAAPKKTEPENTDPKAPIDYTKPPRTKPLYGRYAGMTPGTDPRVDMHNVQTYAAMGMLELSPPGGEGVPDDYDEFCQAMAEPLSGYQQLCDHLCGNAPSYEVERKEVQIDGVDGNKIPLLIIQGSSKTLYYYIHGGGLMMLSCRREPYTLILNTLAGKHGMTIVAPDFRNYVHHPDENIKPTRFPAGLNDCYSGLQWAREHMSELGCETLVVVGESGGGNLALTTTLKTLKEGQPELLDGTFAMCPYTDNDVFSERYPSIIENDCYDLAMRTVAGQKSMNRYTEKEEDQKNPLAWPMLATAEDLKGMKPVVISVNELDPLRDCGLEFYRKLLKAGVRAEARVVAGTMHTGDLMALDDPVLLDTTANTIKSFAARLRGKVLVEADAPAPKPAQLQDELQEEEGKSEA